MAGGTSNAQDPTPGSASWWQARAARPRRASTLTAERIVTAAIALLDAEGLDAFTMRRLADRLGTAPGSLYRHFESREAVLVAVHDQVIGEGIDTDPAGDTWGERIANLVRSQRRVLQERPYLASIWSTTEQLGPNALLARERALRLAMSVGLPPELAARAYLSVVHYTIGFAVIERSFSFRTPESQRATQAYFEALPEADFPATRSLSSLLAQSSLDEEFELGLQALVTGLQALAAQAGIA